jgi:hypothetical protein
MKIQHYFIGLEGAIIGIAVFMLNLFHPGLCLKDLPQLTTRIEEAEPRRWYERKQNETSEQSGSEAIMA